jgi:Sulfotransferase domain
VQAERDGYKKAYEVTAHELGAMRITAAPHIRPDDHPIPNVPSIFIVTLPKSGTLFIGHSIRQALGTDFTNTLVTPSFPKNIVWPAMAWDFTRGGMTSVSHMQADVQNVAILKDEGITKGVLHIRDPRSALNSWFHFQSQLAREAIDRPRPGLVGNIIRSEFMSLSREAQLERLIETYYRPAVQWIADWVRLLESDKDLNYLVTTHEQLAQDEAAYFRRVMSYYCIDKTVRPLSKTSDVHFRAGNNTGWRDTFNARQIARLSSIIPDSLWKRFQWPM